MSAMSHSKIILEACKAYSEKAELLRDLEEYHAETPDFAPAMGAMGLGLSLQLCPHLPGNLKMAHALKVRLEAKLLEEMRQIVADARSDVENAEFYLKELLS